MGFLKSLGIIEFSYFAPALRIPYFDGAGNEAAVRFRIALHGRDRFRWKKGSKASLYGLNRLSDVRATGSITIVEGESDCHTLWKADFAAIGVPGACNWREDRDAPLPDGFAAIYVVIEPDHGGGGVLQWVARSTIRGRVRLVRLNGFKDPSCLYLDDPERFIARWTAALEASMPWTEEERASAENARTAAWRRCEQVALHTDILASFAKEIAATGVVGEDRVVKLVYLAVTSRQLSSPLTKSAWVDSLSV
jgi:hypothetical protein